MDRKSSSISYYASLITGTATREPGAEAELETIEIDGQLLELEDDHVPSGKTLDEAINNGLRVATQAVDN